jgi:hypothetical protein
MTEPITKHLEVRAALRDVALALGGAAAVHGLDDRVVRDLAQAVGAVAARHLGQSAGMSGSVEDASRLRPHPAIIELLVRIAQPAAAPTPEAPANADREWQPMPGLFRWWEIEQVIEAGDEFLIREDGQDAAGTTLFAVHTRPHAEEEGAQ